MSTLGKSWSWSEESKKNKGKNMIGVLVKEKNGRWKGDNVGYVSLHKWVRKHLGEPDTCEHCNRTGLNGRYIHWANKSHEYKRDFTDWIRLCVPCHQKYDNVTEKRLKTLKELPK